MIFGPMSRLYHTAIIFCLFIQPLHSWTQERSTEEQQVFATLASIRKKIDSLKVVLHRAKNNDRVDCYNLLSAEYVTLSSDTAWRFASTAYDSSKNAGYWKGTGEALLMLAQITQERGDVQGAEKYFQQATELYRQHTNGKEYYKARRRLGYNLFLQLRYNEARLIFEQALDYFTSINDREAIAYTNREIGKTYNDQGFFEKAAEYFQKDMAITRTLAEKGTRSSLFMWGNFYLAQLYKDAGDKKLAINYYRLSASRAVDNKVPDVYNSRMGDVHELSGNYDSARYYYRKTFHLLSIRLVDSALRLTFLIEPAIQVAKTFLQQNQFDSALFYLKTPLTYTSPSKFFTLPVFIMAAIAYKGQKDYSRSMEYTDKLLAIAQRANARQFISNAFKLKWQIYHETGQRDSSYKYHLLYSALKDTLASDEQLRNMIVAQMKSENQLLANEKKIAQQQQQILIIVFAAILLIVIVVYRNILLKRRNESIKSTQLENELKMQKLEAETTKAALHQQATELEMQALRSQMNPHFIFNSINSINRFILQNNKLQASEYLTKFSRLMRMVLHNSQSSLITLQTELEALGLYLDLEATRFEHHFSHTISVAEDMDIEILKLPPLLLQPFIENAIWHGLMHKEEKGRVDIELSCEDEYLRIKITDDGIGRKRAAELKSKSATRHHSMGLKITTDRILMVQKYYGKEPPVKINDLVHADGSPAGTEVIIKIPIMYDQSNYDR